MIKAAIVGALLTSSSVLAAWTPDDLLAAKYLGQPDLAPDGSRVVYTLSETRVGETESRTDTHLWLSNTDGESFQLTRGDGEDFAPRFSPDGKWIAFLSTRGDRAPNLYLIRPDGGEALRWTTLDGGVDAFLWSADGSEIAFRAQDGPSEATEQAKKAKADARVVDTDFRFHHLYRLRVAGELAPPEPKRVTSGDFDVDSFDWSPDGKTFVFSRRPTPKIFEWRNTDLALVAAEGGPIRDLVVSPGMDTSPRFSPDGKTIAFVSDRGQRVWARDWRLCTVPATGGAVSVLTPTSDGMPGEDLEGRIVSWAPDGSGLFYAETQRTDVQLFFLPIGGGAPKRATHEPGLHAAFRARKDGQSIAYVLEDFAHAPEVYSLDLLTGERRRWSAANLALPSAAVVTPEIVRWRVRDREIEGILYLPAEPTSGHRLPLLVELHGGPTHAFANQFGLWPYNFPQLLVDAGFAVLQINPSGSTGYGREHRLSLVGDWGGRDFEEVMAGVDALITRGLVDGDRLGVFGWSYGGFLTQATISQTTRFGAAVVGAGPTNLSSMAGTADIEGFITSNLAGDIWDKPELYTARSSVFHADRITTPTLVLHGEEDRRVPVGQGFELYHALRRAGKTTEMVIYPRSGHGVGEPKLAADIARRHLEWFSRWLAPKP